MDRCKEIGCGCIEIGCDDTERRCVWIETGCNGVETSSECLIYVCFNFFPPNII